MSWTAAGERLKRVLERPSTFAILYEYGGDGWTAGGCRLLGEALVKILPQARLRCICSRYTERATRKKLPWYQQHVVTEVARGVFLDGDGTSSWGELRDRWEAELLLGRLQRERFSSVELKLCPAKEGFNDSDDESGESLIAGASPGYQWADELADVIRKSGVFA